MSYETKEYKQRQYYLIFKCYKSVVKSLFHTFLLKLVTTKLLNFFWGRGLIIYYMLYIKITMSHTNIENKSLEDKCECDETFKIPLLYVSCSIKEGKIHTDLNRKKTDINTYLRPSSCHPTQIFKSISFSLGLRIVRTCSNKEDKDKRLLELKHYFLARRYEEEKLEAAVTKARAIPKNRALKQST